MISDNFWKILFILMLLTGLVFWFKDYSAKKDLKRNAAQLADLISFEEGARARNDEEAHRRFIGAFTLVHEAEREGIDRGRLIDAAFEYNEVNRDGTVAGLVRDALSGGIEAGNALGIFNEDSIWDLQDGQPVEITEGPFAGEKIAVTHRVPPSIAPGARLFVGNFLIVPESVAAVSRDVELTEDVRNVSNKLAAAEIISQDDAKAIKTQYYELRKRRPN